MKLLSMVTAATLFLGAPAALPQLFKLGEWIEIPNNVPGKALLLSTKTIVSDGPYKKAWLLTDWEEGQSLAGRYYHSALQVDLYACERRVFATRAMHLYVGRLATGDHVRRIERESGNLKWEEIPLGSPSEAILLAVCGGLQSPKPR